MLFHVCLICSGGRGMGGGLQALIAEESVIVPNNALSAE